ncbi:MAG TPA: hypothetical protein VGO89_10135, partial [Streptomyces sp.]|nr:hypothetical protein [Streptomyces sp.]
MGLFKRIGQAVGKVARRVTGREKPAAPAPPPEAPPTAPAPPAPSAGPPAPLAEPGAPVPEAGEPGEPGEGEEEEEEEEEREYPTSLYVSASGSWKVSDTEWEGTMHGSISGDDVKAFIDAMEEGDLPAAAEVVALAYDNGQGISDVIDTAASRIDHIG